MISEPRKDPRSARSGAALNAAVLALAASQPPASISVTELVKLAGVSRKTFYNHAATPGELLARVLTAELDEARDAAEAQRPIASDDLESAVHVRLGAILQHVHDRRDVYLPSAGGVIPTELYQVLTDHFGAAVCESISASHRKAPTVPGFSDPDHRAVSVEMYSSYAAHAYAGAIQSWLQHPETGEVGFILGLIVTALPDWMAGRNQGRAGSQR